MIKKGMIIAIILCLMVSFLGMISYSSKTTNPFVGIKGLVQIQFLNKGAEKITEEPTRYIEHKF